MQVADSQVVYSSYYVESLDETVSARYREKLAMLGGAQHQYNITIIVVNSRGELAWLAERRIPRYFKVFPDIHQYLYEAAAESVQESGGLYIDILWMAG